MGPAIRVVLLSGLVLAHSSCMTFELEGDGAKTIASAHGSETVHGSLYGFEWGGDSRSVVKCSDGLGLYRVEFHTNVLYLLASVATVGLYVPQTVEWWCQAPPPADDDGEILPPIED